MSCSLRARRCSSLISYFVLWISGIIQVGLSTWFFLNYKELQHTSNIAGIDFSKHAIQQTILLLLGAVMIFINSVLFICTCLLSEKTERFLSVITFVIIILVAATVTPFLIHDHKNFPAIRTKLNETMMNLTSVSGEFHPSLKESVNYIQIRMKCCGSVEGPSDWRSSNWWNQNKQTSGETVPDSCCAELAQPIDYTLPLSSHPQLCYQAAYNLSMVDRENYVHTQACTSPMIAIFSQNINNLIAAMSVHAVAVIAVLGVTILFFCCKSRPSPSSTYQPI